jgi:hypothetical protein
MTEESDASDKLRDAAEATEAADAEDIEAMTESAYVVSVVPCVSAGSESAQVTTTLTNCAERRLRRPIRVVKITVTRDDGEVIRERLILPAPVRTLRAPKGVIDKSTDRANVEAIVRLIQPRLDAFPRIGSDEVDVDLVRLREEGIRAVPCNEGQHESTGERDDGWECSHINFTHSPWTKTSDDVGKHEITPNGWSLHVSCACSTKDIGSAHAQDDFREGKRGDKSRWQAVGRWEEE